MLKTSQKPLRNSRKPAVFRTSKRKRTITAETPKKQTKTLETTDPKRERPERICVKNRRKRRKTAKNTQNTERKRQIQAISSGKKNIRPAETIKTTKKKQHIPPDLVQITHKKHAKNHKIAKSRETTPKKKTLKSPQGILLDSPSTTAQIRQPTDTQQSDQLQTSRMLKKKNQKHHTAQGNQEIEENQQEMTETTTNTQPPAINLITLRNKQSNINLQTSINQHTVHFKPKIRLHT